VEEPRHESICKSSLWCRTYSGPSKDGSRLICPELRLTMDRRPEYSPMTSITEMFQDPHVPKPRPCHMEYKEPRALRALCLLGCLSQLKGLLC
jgi:hypothetical protein